MLQVTQNNHIRFILNLHPRSHIGKDQFVRPEWLSIVSSVNQTAVCRVFKIRAKLVPSYLGEILLLLIVFITRIRDSELIVQDSI